MQEYRSGHNEAVLKTVWVKAHVGSNPTPSAKQKDTERCPFCFGEGIERDSKGRSHAVAERKLLNDNVCNIKAPLA